MSQQFDLGATIIALGLGEVLGRRNFEAFRDWAKLERDWLNQTELDHLKRAVTLAKKHNRSLRDGLERTLTSDAQGKPSNEPARLSEMARELSALRSVSEDSRRHQDALIARLKTEDSYYAAWEKRLCRSEEELLALWNLLDEVIQLSSESIPRLEKLERRVGYGLRRVSPEPEKPKRSDKPKSS